MDADHRRQLLENLPVDGKCVDHVAVGQQRVGAEQLPPGRVLGPSVERGDRLLFDGVVRVTEGIPGTRKLWRKLCHPAQLRNGISEPAGRAVFLGQDPARFDICRSSRDGPFESRNALSTVIAGLRAHRRRDDEREKKRQRVRNLLLITAALKACEKLRRGRRTRFQLYRDNQQR